MKNLKMFVIFFLPALLFWGCEKNVNSGSQITNPPPATSSDVPPATLNNLAPDFTLPDLNGNQVSLKDFRGQTVLLVFWGSRCPICLDEIPELEKIEEEYRDKKFKLITINADLNIDKAKKFVAAKGIKHLVLVDDPDYRAATSYKVRAYPLAKFVIDHEGYLQSSGELTKVRQRLAELIK